MTYSKPCKKLVAKGGSQRRHLDSTASALSHHHWLAVNIGLSYPLHLIYNCASRYNNLSLFSPSWILLLTLRPGIVFLFFFLSVLCITEPQDASADSVLSPGLTSMMSKIIPCFFHSHSFVFFFYSWNILIHLCDLLANFYPTFTAQPSGHLF